MILYERAGKGVLFMAIEAEKRRPQDISKINVNEHDEVRWWCGQLSCNEMRLKNAVMAVGQSAEAVRKYLHP